MYILPFDHRSGFAKDILHCAYPFGPTDLSKAQILKNLIWKAFLTARTQVKHPEKCAILADEETCFDILMEAQTLSVPFFLTLERSGPPPFTALYANEELREKLRAWRPGQGKMLIRIPFKTAQEETLQIKNLQETVAVCNSEKTPFLLEIVSEQPSQQREQIITSTIDTLHDAKIVPALWKLEGLPTISAWKKVATHAQAPLVMLGRGESKETVKSLLQIAKASSVVSGFAVGRTVFAEPLQQFLAKAITAEQTIQSISENFLECCQVWEESS